MGCRCCRFGDLDMLRCLLRNSETLEDFFCQVVDFGVVLFGYQALVHEDFVGGAGYPARKGGPRALALLAVRRDAAQR